MKKNTCKADNGEDYILKLLYNKWVALVLLVVGCGYITFYGFLKDPIHFTASMIGLDYPRLFCLWGILSVFSLFTNINYMYHKYGKRNLAAFICTVLSGAFAFL